LPSVAISLGSELLILNYGHPMRMEILTPGTVEHRAPCQPAKNDP
jgi:hypothetical protein